MFTNTFKASLVVDAHPIQTHVPDQTLIHVWGKERNKQTNTHTHTCTRTHTLALPSKP